MKVLVAYESRHGATQGIAERIAGTLRADGLDVDAIRARSVKDVRDYDAFVIGSAAYMFHWLREAGTFVRRNRAFLATKPVWLFSSGPLGSEPTDAQGRDQKVVSIPKEIPELMELAAARDHHVFFGAWDPSQPPAGIAERFMKLLPAAREGIPAGDFRDWTEIDAWAHAIALELASPVPGPVAQASPVA
jgi:menaquinone-dependent protoporphyrinogen oxidase